MTLELSLNGFHEFVSTGLQWPKMEICAECKQPKNNYKHLIKENETETSSRREAND